MAGTGANGPQKAQLTTSAPSEKSEKPQQHDPLVSPHSPRQRAARGDSPGPGTCPSDLALTPRRSGSYRRDPGTWPDGNVTPCAASASAQAAHCSSDTEGDMKLPPKSDRTVPAQGRVRSSARRALSKRALLPKPPSTRPASMPCPATWRRVGGHLKSPVSSTMSLLPAEQNSVPIWAEEMPMKEYLHKNHQLLLPFSTIKKKKSQKNI